MARKLKNQKRDQRGFAVYADFTDDYGANVRVKESSAASPVVTVMLFVIGQLTSRLNGSGARAHWSVIAREAAFWRHRTWIAWLAAGRPTLEGPAVVTFTVYVGRLWDSDNLPAAVKSIRDEVVRRVLEGDDGPMGGHAFHYEQEVRPKGERGVLIEIEPRPAPLGLGGT